MKKLITITMLLAMATPFGAFASDPTPEGADICAGDRGEEQITTEGGSTPEGTSGSGAERDGDDGEE